MVLAPLNHLSEDSFVDLKTYVSKMVGASREVYSTYIGNGDRVVLADGVITNIFKHVLDQHGTFGNDTV